MEASSWQNVPGRGRVACSVPALEHQRLQDAISVRLRRKHQRVQGRTPWLAPFLSCAITVRLLVR